MIHRSIFKAGDVRGLHPEHVNDESIRHIAKALSHTLPAGKVVIAHDGRHGSPTLAEALIEEMRNFGISIGKEFDITFAGLSTTPMFYFLVNHLEATGGAMITASHNPKEYNGVKAVRAEAIPITGIELLEIIDIHGI